ncbi:Chanoclavine-I aldehyde reductase [Penicillium cataractarum]|uniref:chanoclavine-I aldehyde reductase n=1 Tax=Penicillium cataractarum TaxID=2100454 RepID=A0A9W9VV10_9EURO|nr:Chanoclavine-I aldehyde reductase [Penicillium cataractarum]KAJ5389882.1 Chanoclavine-I aldehyde reductase [Penicillium cataractarum]
MTKLFTPLRVGRMELQNRIAMAPMTRFRVSDDHVPLPLVKEHYAQRASTPGTLLITEATLITPQAGLYANVPGIWNDAQIAAWKEVTDAVHAKGSYIYMQLWALGRVGSADLLKASGFDLVSASDIPVSSEAPIPRPLTEEEIQSYIQDYAQAARNAVAAGFDGVEIHGANGYLIDQFIQDVTNKRTDRWGGSVENRARFAIEITRAVSDAIGADRTAIRFSPYSTFQGMRMENPHPQFEYLARELAPLKLAYTHVVEGRIAGNADTESADELQFFLDAYQDAGPVVIAGGYQPASAKEAVDQKYKDHEVVIGFGRPFTSNPDLPFRIKENVPLVPHSRDVLYLPKNPKGYNDWEFSAEYKKTVEAAA